MDVLFGDAGWGVCCPADEGCVVDLGGDGWLVVVWDGEGNEMGKGVLEGGRG